MSSPTNQLNQALDSEDRHQCMLAIHQISSTKNITLEFLFELLDLLPRIVETFPERHEWEYEGIMLERYEFDGLVWDIGEQFRQILKAHRRFRRNPDLFLAIEQVALDRKYQKGRESFVMLLGQYGDPDRIPALRNLLEDDKVNGHAVYAIRLLAPPELEDDMRPFLNHKKTWVRNNAKKYFAKIDKK